jgi:ParB-like chromosome segregation protein Spo0J
MNIEHWPLTKLKPYCRNLRENDHAVAKMVESINTYGFKIPVLALGNGEVIDGHLRIKGAQQAGMEEVPVVLCDGWSEAKVKAFRLLVNRSATWADFDPEAVALELEDLKALDFDLSLTGFDPHEIDEYLFSGLDEKDEESTVQEHTITRAGDLWILGTHRPTTADVHGHTARVGIVGRIRARG